jgi:membrane protease YdiL (CAAX protease family)
MADMLETDGTPALISQPLAAPERRNGPRTWFFGAGGLRAGWRLLLFFAIIAAFNATLRLILTKVFHRPLPTQVTFSAKGILLADTGTFLLFLLVSWIMARIEGRTIADYGLPARAAFGSKFWQGLVIGFSAVSFLLLGLRVLGVFHFDGLGVHGWDIPKYAAFWGAAFLAVGFTEEFTFRGYTLFTLSTGIGFWPSAILMSSLFAFAHYFNPNETWAGLTQVFWWGMMACIALRRTGSLWLPIGLHAGWDWAETCFYGVADSGQVAPGHLLSTSFSGPQWLTGGVAGPEGSWLCSAMLVGICLLFAASWSGAARYPNRDGRLDSERKAELLAQ